MAHVLITGGKGMIGTYLTDLLMERGYDVSHLIRERTGAEKIKTYTWQIEKNEVEKEAIEYADFIVHLAGANLSTKRWTEKRKDELVKSRTESSYLLYQKLRTLRHHVKAVIASSAVGYYGHDSGYLPVSEDSPPGKDFIASLCEKWEYHTSQIKNLKLRVVQFRTGVVLSKRGGMLKKLLPFAKAGLIAPLGSGKQYMSWIHIEDLCRMYVQAIEDASINGAYNAVAPNPVTNREFMKALAKAVKRPFIIPGVPKFALKLVYGEMGTTVLGSIRASGAKIESAGFEFHFPFLEEALGDVLRS